MLTDMAVTPVAAAAAVAVAVIVVVGQLVPYRIKVPSISTLNPGS